MQFGTFIALKSGEKLQPYNPCLLSHAGQAPHFFISIFQEEKMVENIEQRSPDDEVVMDKPTSQWSDLWKKEDYMAIWLGFFILLVGVLIYFNNAPSGMEQTISSANATLEEQAGRAPFKTIEWYQAMDAKSKLKATGSSVGKTIK